MAPDDESRHDLFALLERDTSRETAAALMRHIPPAGWPDFATKDDLSVVRAEVHAYVHAKATRTIRWAVSTLIAAVAAGAAVAGVVAANAS